MISTDVLAAGEANAIGLHLMLNCRMYECGSLASPHSDESVVVALFFFCISSFLQFQWRYVRAIAVYALGASNQNDLHVQTLMHISV